MPNNTLLVKEKFLLIFQVKMDSASLLSLVAGCMPDKESPSMFQCYNVINFCRRFTSPLNHAFAAMGFLIFIYFNLYIVVVFNCSYYAVLFRVTFNWFPN